jgi:hypothetical protein
MKLTVSNDRYHVHWTAHIEQGRTAAQWCHDSFGAGWGYDASPPDLRYHADWRFTFYKLYHAQWFMAKWAA